MDLYVERQSVDLLRKGDAKHFILLFDEYFSDLYKYVRRRVFDLKIVEKIVRLTFLDALGQMKNTPTDLNFSVWLYSLAKPRIWSYLEQTNGEIDKLELVVDNLNIKPESEDERALAMISKMLKKLSFEEREILRLKFFEQVSDGDVMVILGGENGTIGPRIYKVLKRAHFLLFGESDQKQGVYFGELGSFLIRIRELENINVSEGFKLNLKNDLFNKIEKKDFVIDAELVKEDMAFEKERTERKKAMNARVGGSNDPAKIFVEAVKELKDEENKKKEKMERKEERREKAMFFFERWRVAFTIVPTFIILFIVLFFALKLIDFGSFIDKLSSNDVENNGQTLVKIERGYANTCDIDVRFEGAFSDTEKRKVNKGITDKLCDYYEVKTLLISRVETGVVEVELDVPDWFLEYKFVNKLKRWRINTYERTFNSNGEHREISAVIKDA